MVATNSEATKRSANPPEVAKQVLEARIDELDRYFVGTPNLYYDQRVARLRKKLTKLTRAQGDR